MGFQPGATNNDDGGNGFTEAKDKSGLVGHCEFTSDVAAPGGSGVFGFTKAGKGCGVFGANLHSATGVGVQGNGPEAGVSGFSKIGVGLRGFTEATDQSAVFGMNTASGPVPGGLGRPAGAGVWGHTHVEKGSGIVGSVEPGLTQAAGVTGIGPVAGQFFGNVTASGGGVDQNTVFGFNGATGSVPDGLNRPAGSGVWGHTKVEKGSGIVGSVEPGLTKAAGVTGIGPLAGQFFGNVTASGGGIDQNTVFGFNGATGSVPPGLNRPAGSGVWGHTKVEKGSGIVGSVEPGLTQAAGVTGIGPLAGQFFGDVKVFGDVQLVGGDCAEDFDIAGAEAVAPGTVMVINATGSLQPSEQAYDRKVAGVISGAGGYRPGVVLDRQVPAENRTPIALVGKVYCKADADYGPIEVGDLLTSSPTKGHAMKASDPLHAFGAVIGKALGSLNAGQGLIPILIALQ